MDHLVKIVSKICPDSKIAQGLACGRTKTTSIVKYVLGEHGFDTLRQHLRNVKFSLIVDESTDRKCEKEMCMVVRSYRDDNIKDDFFGLIKLSSADALTLYNHIVEYFTSNDIPYKQNLIGFASDGANVLMGHQHSVMSLLKKDIPALYVMKCICHSFHLCASYACQKLPRFVEDLTRDVYNYFSSSPKRTSQFLEFQEFCDVKAHKILHPAQTRWLSVHSAISRILEQYGALQLYFTDAVSQNDLLAAENILTKLRDPTTKLFLQFLDFILPFFTNLNKEMQSESPKIHLIYKNVTNILRSIFDCFLKRNYVVNTPLENIDYKNPKNFLAIEDIYLGGNVMKTISESTISQDQLTFFRLRCLDFYTEGCSQIIQRFPLKNNVLEKLDFVDPAIIKSGSVSSLVPIALLFPNLIQPENLQNLDNQWRLLRNTKDINTLSNDVILFWQEVHKMERGDGELAFNLLVNFVKCILSLPVSSANVERKFSQLNLIKTNQRMSLNSDTTASLLYAKEYIGVKNCYDFPVDKKLINSMTSTNLYRE